jgi:16S rRNA C967 or C1407 C5-methylase (RsmB/RsmF family)/NOL1/NOP2/fmu family ribosome biogenesis protein
MKKLPEAFLKNISEILGNEKEDFIKALELKPEVSIRENPLKKVSLEYLDIEGPVLWCESGYYLNQRPAFTLDPLFHGGAYYVQEASSMFLEEVIKQTKPKFDRLRVLDLCSAPGGKSTHLASLLGPDDLLVCNEVIKSRLSVLKENLQKWGYPNIIISNQDPETFYDLAGFFDIVLVDAPCSGEGLFRKDSAAVDEWSENLVQMCSLRQQRILSSAAILVAQGGVLIYSTCTYNRKENQENANWLKRTFEFEYIDLNISNDWNVTEKENGYQFFPHKTRGEGFYIAAFKKTGREFTNVKGRINLQRLSRQQLELLEEWIEKREFDNFDFFIKNDGNIVAIKTSLVSDYGVVLKSLQKRSSGLEIGIFKGKNFVPSHALALSTLLNKNFPAANLEKAEALKFLKKESFDVPNDLHDGWVIIKYQNINLGWIKKIGNRVNNYLPTEWRIRMDLE